jgi:hypothetical protein
MRGISVSCSLSSQNSQMFRNSLFEIVLASGFISSLFCPSIIYALMASKRFNKVNAAGFEESPFYT